MPRKTAVIVVDTTKTRGKPLDNEGSELKNEDHELVIRIQLIR